MTTTASQRGRANRAKGGRAERHLARWLNTVGWPHAERGRDNGYRAANRTAPDGYDIAGCPGLLWDTKDVADRELYRVPEWLAKVVADARAQGLLGLLVVKRRGCASPARWHCHAMLGDLVGSTAPDYDLPVRMDLGHVVPLLWLLGYGEPCDAPGIEATG